jgi:curved DNA-binding protein CbpA
MRAAGALTVLLLQLMLGGRAAGAWWPFSSGAGDCAAPVVGDPYEVLGVEKDTEPSKVTKAYRKLAMRWHPDKNREPGMTEDGKNAKFAAIANAYDILTDPEKKEIWQRLGQDGLERLRNGDPSVKKDWKPPPRIEQDGIDWVIYSIAK